MGIWNTCITENGAVTYISSIKCLQSCGEACMTTMVTWEKADTGDEPVKYVYNIDTNYFPSIPSGPLNNDGSVAFIQLDILWWHQTGIHTHTHLHTHKLTKHAANQVRGLLGRGIIAEVNKIKKKTHIHTHATQRIPKASSHTWRTACISCRTATLCADGSLIPLVHTGPDPAEPSYPSPHHTWPHPKKCHHLITWQSLTYRQSLPTSQPSPHSPPPLIRNQIQVTPDYYGLYSQTFICDWIHCNILWY